MPWASRAELRRGIYCSRANLPAPKLCQHASRRHKWQTNRGPNAQTLAGDAARREELMEPEGGEGMESTSSNALDVHAGSANFESSNGLRAVEGAWVRLNHQKQKKQESTLGRN